ncbi:unnamed protein product [Malus baccata var. baccata]
MFGISYGELFLLIGATAALVGPKDLPRIARAAGRLAGRSIGYVQLARGQFDNVMQQSQARQVHKELQDALAQLESICYEVRGISLMNPGPMTRKLIDNIQDPAPLSSGTNISLEKPKEDSTLRTSDAPNFHSQATAYAKLAESDAVKTGTLKSGAEKDDLYDESGLFIVLPISAESTGMLPNRKENVKGSDLVLEAVVEAEVARNAKDFFSQPENQIQGTEK